MIFAYIPDNPYPDYVVDIPSDAVNSEFIDRMGQLIRRLAAAQPARKIPSQSECAFYDITPTDCPERVMDDGPGHGTTRDF